MRYFLFPRSTTDPSLLLHRSAKAKYTKFMKVVIRLRFRPVTKNVDIYLFYVIKISVATYLLNVFSASLVNFHVISQFARGARIRRRNTCPPFRESSLSRKSSEILLSHSFSFRSRCPSTFLLQFRLDRIKKKNAVADRRTWCVVRLRRSQ